MSKNIQRKAPRNFDQADDTGHAPVKIRGLSKQMNKAADAFLKRRGLAEPRRWNGKPPKKP